MSRFLRIATALALSSGPFLLTACGAGTAALVSGSGSGGGNAATVLSGFQLQGAKVSPATIAFTVVDEEADPARVELLYALPGEAPRPMTHLTPLTAGLALDGNVATATSSANGVTHRFSWDFTAEAGLPSDGRFVPGAGILARIEGGTQGLILGANADALGLGNDAPEILAVIPPAEDEVSGVVPVGITVADSSSDVVSIRIEYDVLGDLPDVGWQLARPANPFGGGTPEFAIEGVESSEEGVDLVFIWDTDHDLFQKEVDVRLRVTADDRTLDLAGEPIGLGPSLESDVVRVDNNAVPILTIQGDVLLSSEDERFGIPIPYRVVDPEGDPVEVVFQYRRQGEQFPDLPATKSEIEAILRDPIERRAHHVATEYRRPNGGRLVPVDEDTVRLPELGSSMAHLAAGGVQGRLLELLRPSSVPELVAETWSQNPLARPVAALPLGDGLTALVLDSPGAGGWTLLELELATGRLVRTVASEPAGSGTAMCFERSGEVAVLLASDLAGAWTLQRVELATGAVSTLGSMQPGEPLGPVRGIAGVGAHTAMFAAGAALVRLDYPEGGAARTAVLVDGLETPWGVAADPLDSRKLYVAERDALVAGGRGRVLAVRVDTLEIRPLGIDAGALSGPGFGRPEALAIDPAGRRLYALARQGGLGAKRLVGLALEPGGAARAFLAWEAGDAEVCSVAAGPDGLRLLALPQDAELAVGGGVQQRRAVQAFDPATLEVDVAAPFAPSPRRFQPWRFARPGSVVPGTGGAVLQRFVWDSSDLAPEGAGQAFFRAVALDTEPGLPDETGAARRYASIFSRPPKVVGQAGIPAGPHALTTADLDGDGDLDLLCTKEDTSELAIFFQEAPESFAGTPLLLGGPGVTDEPRAVAASDVDGDGDLDVLSANRSGDDLTVFFQTAPGSFAVEPVALAAPGVTVGPGSVAAADLNGDGALDVLSANASSLLLSVFFQDPDAPGSFDEDPLVLGGEGITNILAQAITADVDADGDVDVVCAVASGLRLFLQTPAGEFDAELLSSQALFINFWSPIAADLDGDGDLDLGGVGAVFPFGFYAFGAWSQTEPGVFEWDHRWFDLTGSTDYPTSASAADVDGDGVQEVLLTRSGSSAVTVYRRSLLDSFGAEPLVLGGPGATDEPASLIVADVNGDGAADLVSANSAGNDLTAFYRETAPSFSPAPLVLGGDGSTENPRGLVVTDVDGDGDLDVLSANRVSSSLTLFFQDGAGGFLAEPLVFGGFDVAPEGVVAGDLDGDGDLDIVARDQCPLNASNRELIAYWQVSPGTFERASLGLAPVRGPGALVIADVDLDGDPDLLGTDRFLDYLFVYFQSAPGVFDPDPVVLGGFEFPNGTVTDEPQGIAAADLDADGDLEVFCANADGDDLTVFFQQEDGSFDPDPMVLGGSGVTIRPRSLAAADLDDDGDLDLVCANRGGNDLTVFFQLAPGAFSPDPLVLGGPGVTDAPQSVVAVDVDGDGDLDLVCTNRDSDDLAVFLQTSPGTFSPHPRRVGGTGLLRNPGTLVAVDLDEDGTIDLVTTNTGSDDLTVFWGGR